jgi:hypothetical protein
MKLSELKSFLNNQQEVRFLLPHGAFVKPHFHITEIGRIDKAYVDCGGTVRKEHKISFQLWIANDTDHRLAPARLLEIIQVFEKHFGDEDAELEVEYQMNTIGKYELEAGEDCLLLKPTFTDCLAKDNCGIPEEQLQQNNACTPGSGCC